MDMEILYYVIEPDALESVKDENDRKHITEGVELYEIIQNKIDGYDEYDGGADYEAIILEKSTGRFFRCNYNDWQMARYDGWCAEFHEGIDLDTRLREVFPEQKTITIYK